jgi:hypothetical protein
LEIHPPDHPIMTWKQFIVHMSTIVLGVLIAIGLEQSVERFHHRQERDALLADMRAESSENMDVTRLFLDYSATEIDVTGQWADALAAAPVKNGYINLPVPAALRERDQLALHELWLRHPGGIVPNLSVLATARESQQIQYLPVEDARFFSELVHFDDLVNETYSRGTAAIVKYRSYISFVPKSPFASIPSQDVVTMTTADRDNAVESLRTSRANLIEVRLHFGPVYQRLSAIADGVRTDREFNEWQKSHPLEVLARMIHQTPAR